MPIPRKWAYSFGDGKADGRGNQKELLGGKGTGLAEMTRIGLPVPPGFTITTDACARCHRAGGKWPSGLDREVRQALSKLERTCKKEFGATRDPLLVSVRSGAARSMPGMMETILNLGLNDRSVEGLAEVSGSRRFALDAYRRLIMMYGSTAKGIRREHFENALDLVKQTRTRARPKRASDERVLDTDVNAEELEQLVDNFKRMYREYTGEQFPQNPLDQLKGAIVAVFDSWMAEKAVTYRRVERISGLAGTAVNVCRMVFGNMGKDSGTGVCFSRDPSTGEAVFYGDMLINAQGEDVVAGIRTPMKLAELKTLMPKVYEQLEAARAILEVHYRDMQDLEFTIERGKLYMLQCRVGKRSPVAAFKIAVDQATKGLMSPAAARRLVKKKYLPKKYAAAAAKPVITKDEAIQRIEPADIERLFYPVLDPDVKGDELERRWLGQGTGAVPGAACGEVVFTAEDAETRATTDAAAILVRKETSPEDVGGMYASAGILTATGGKTSHAAVVARGWGKCCIVGCSALAIDYNDKTMMLGAEVLREGDAITLDGSTGRIFKGRIGLVRPDAPPEYRTLMGWCDKRRRLKVYTNADTPSGAEKGLDLGAEGIGLCRTEHMFFDPSQPQRIRAMREMILAETLEHRRRVLEKLLPYQREDFEGILTVMHGRPVTIRLLDPPLHEFLPHHDNPAGQQAVVDELNDSMPPELPRGPTEDRDTPQAFKPKRVTIDDIRRRVDQLREANPMLGHRGCRLCISYPEILEMQVRAIIEAAVNCARNGTKVLPEIMIPLSIDPKELSILVDRVRGVADVVLKEQSRKVKYLVGTMIETPRAALVADRMAEVAEFFSFGTNDLTQLTLAISRDDAGRFLPDYVDPAKAGVFSDHPFQSIDIEGVGVLLKMAVDRGKAARPKLKLGICGEHGGDPASIRFCEEIGLDYVSCSPLRVPIARLAAAQAAITVKTAGPGIVKSNAKPRSIVRPRRAKERTTNSRKAPTRKGPTKKRSKRARP